MDMPLRPRWVYNDGSVVDYAMQVPQRPWAFGSIGHGGSDVTASGSPSAHEIRRDYTLGLGLRFRESEWPNVERVLRHLQRAGVAQLFLDADVDDVSHLVYVQSPTMGEPVRTRRSQEPSTLEMDVVVRSVAGAIFEEAYFENADAPWFFREVDGVLVMTDRLALATHFLDTDAGGFFVNDVRADADATLRYQWGRARMFES